MNIINIYLMFIFLSLINSSETTVLVSQNGPITLIGINRPAKKNCLDVVTAQKLSEALDAFENDETSSVGILHGIGGSFSSGFDLDEIARSNIDSDEGFPHFGPLVNFLKLLHDEKYLAVSS